MNEVNGETFEKVYKDEAEAIRSAREGRGEEDLKAPLVGLAFSGGGIRSATFNLGVLQALAKLGLLRKIDYLSTVSGGGYIGSWLTTWIHHKGLPEVEKGLKGRIDGKEADEIHWLRDYSNYLTPRTGALSADRWAMIAIYLRNVLLNLAILVAGLTAVLLVPRLGVSAYRAVANVDKDALSWALGLLLFGVIAIAVNLSLFGKLQIEKSLKEERKRWAGQAGVQWLVVLPIFLAAWLGSAWLWAGTFSSPAWLESAWLWFKKIPGEESGWMLGGGVIYGVLWLIGWLTVRLTAGQASATGNPQFQTADQTARKERSAGRVRRAYRWVQETGKYAVRTGWSWRWLVVSAGVAGSLGGLLLFGLTELLSSFKSQWENGAVLLAAAFGAPLVVVVFKLTAVLHIGLMGRSFPSGLREWWGRLGAWLFIYTLVWIGLFSISLFGPWLLLQIGVWGGAILGSGWLASTVAGVLAGGGQRTGAGAARPWLERAVQVTPYVFVVGLLLVLSSGIHAYLAGGINWGVRDGFGNYLATLYGSLEPLGPVVALFLVAVLIALALSRRVDINEFSMHNFYRNRLGRCYLGASDPDPRRHPFTGFDTKPGLPLAALGRENGGIRTVGPYPIINATLNMTKGEELAWQERKGASFVFTPLYCGFHGGREHKAGAAGVTKEWYRRTDCYGGKETGGVGIGTAMAISGAAASPNMGYHTSAALAFLMTMFNVRLGWWMGNPQYEKPSEKAGPPWGLPYLGKELFASTGLGSDYVYLSDGGHFENLGIYELVRRRCHLIIACDAEEDAEMKFGGLGNAIQKCRADFGVDIEIDVKPIQKGKTERYGRAHFALGDIRYSKVFPNVKDGKLLYIKSSLTKDIPAGVLSYAEQHKEFPHQTTADQWFDESQFESYRRLGEHICEDVHRDLSVAKDVDEWVGSLTRRWASVEGEDEKYRVLKALRVAVSADAEAGAVKT